MHFNSYEQMNTPGKNALAFIQALGEIGLMAIQKITELQLSFVTTQMENALEQIQCLSNFESDNFFLFPESLWADIYYPKATKNLKVSGNELVTHRAKRLTTVTAPKIRPASRKIRKKNS